MCGFHSVSTEYFVRLVDEASDLQQVAFTPFQNEALQKFLFLQTSTSTDLVHIHRQTGEPNCELYVNAISVAYTFCQVLTVMKLP